MVSRTGVTHCKMLQSLTIPTLMTVCVRNNCVKFFLRALFSVFILYVGISAMFHKMSIV